MPLKTTASGQITTTLLSGEQKYMIELFEDEYTCWTDLVRDAVREFARNHEREKLEAYIQSVYLRKGVTPPAEARVILGLKTKTD